MSGLIHSAREDGLLRVTLHRPEARNALSGEMLALLRDTFDEAAADPSVRVVLLSGEGKDFCAGADIGEMKALGAASVEANLSDAQRLAATFAAIQEFPGPVVARVHGNVFGGGTGLVAASDIAVCSSDSRFAFSEVRLGLVPAVISPFVVRRIGETWARRLFLSGECFGAERAVSIGLCSAGYGPDALDAEIDVVLTDLLRGSPDAQRRIKILLKDISGRPPRDVADVTASHIADARASSDAQEGLRAFLDKRPPSWTKEKEGS